MKGLYKEGKEPERSKKINTVLKLLHNYGIHYIEDLEELLKTHCNKSPKYKKVEDCSIKELEKYCSRVVDQLPFNIEISTSTLKIQYDVDTRAKWYLKLERDEEISV